MAISQGSYLNSFFNTAQAAGAKKISSDFTLEIAGHESMYILTKTCPWPYLAPGAPIETVLPLGANSGQPSQIQTFKEGEIEFYETVANSIDQLLLNLLVTGATFNAKIYEGTPQKYLCYKPIYNAYIQVNDPSRNWENRSQALLVSGTLHYNYFGEVITGNSTAY